MTWRLWLSAVAFTAILSAQSWDDLRGLKPGDSIKVLDTAGHEVKGGFRAVTAEAVTLSTDKGETSIERPKVRRVQIRSESRRARNAAIGVGIGVAVGVTIDATLGAFFRNEGGQSAGSRALTYVVPIGMLGGLAAAFPGYRTVYKAR